jgi:tetratricopeptide (TPR) repeat protein
MKMTSYDMHEELFISMMFPQNHVPLDKDRVAEEWRYYKMSPAISSKYSAVMELSELYKNSGFYDEAIAACEEALGNPQFKDYQAYSYFRMGQVSENKKDFSGALNSYLKSMDIVSNNRHLQYWQHNNIAFCYLIKKDFAAAERHCQIAIDIDDGNWKPRYDSCERNWNAWKNMGVAMEHTGRYLEAASFYTTAIKLSRGTERAVLHLRRLLKRHPDLAETWKEPVQDLLTYYQVVI